MSRPNISIYHLIKYVFALLFAIIISIPVIFKLLGIDYSISDINENRHLADLPKYKETSLKDLPRVWDRYLNDRISLRQVFMPAYIWLWEKTLKSPVSEYVTGKNGELFMNHAAPVVSASLGLLPWNNQQKAELRVSTAGKFALFYSKGIEYYIVLIPDKTTLYPDLLPWYTDLIPHEGWYQTQFSQISKANVPFIALKEYFEKNSDKTRFYDKIFDNCHWNGNALNIAYQIISSKIFKNHPDLTPVTMPEYYELYDQEPDFFPYGRDHTQFIKLNNSNNFTCTEDFPNELKTSEYNKLCTNNSIANGSMWFFSDSYFGHTHGSEAITPFVHNYHTYWHRHYNIDLSKNSYSLFIDHSIKFNKPDVVIESFVERMRGIVISYQDELIRTLGDYWLKTDGIILDQQISKDAFTLDQIEISNSEKSITIKTLGNDSKILFKDIFVADDLGRIYMAVMIKSDINAVAQLFYAAPHENFSESKSITKMIKKGENLFHFNLMVKPHEKIKLRFDPSNQPGTFIIQEIPELKDLREKIKENGI